MSEENNNPYDPKAPRKRIFSLPVNDFDLFEIEQRAKTAGQKKTQWARKKLDLPQVLVGARIGNTHRSPIKRSRSGKKSKVNK